jgi:hypothetical protein
MRLSNGWRVYWTRNEKDTKTHIEVGNYTACGIEIPYYDGVDRGAFSIATCKKCLKKQVSLEGEDSLVLAEKENLKGH